ncbi:hypothetical protein HPB49_011139 [Dermacentor silvarum]|uniref:Uncharacterized protein n=1 Tax=Dermacentor silvarum TaxID=543639 RepID=A0ACB8CES6_DERSI|nr:hypothetical protein HPB49_011139 [Dermacentor silvarum]
MASPMLGACLLRFAVSLHWQLRAEHKHENILSSPFSISTTLLMTVFGAGGNTAKQLFGALHLKECGDDKIDENFSSFLNGVSSYGPNVSFHMANGMYVDREIKVRNQYRLLLNTFYKANIESVDFRKNPEAARGEANAWVFKQTASKIKNLLPSGSVNNATVFMLVNALYFKGVWESPFKASYSKPGNFSVSLKKDVEVTMMRQEGKFKFAYVDDLSSIAVELPYKGGKCSMIIFLPYELEGLEFVEKKLSEPLLLSAFAQLSLGDVRLTLPKFKLDLRENLKHTLEGLGVKDLFTPKTADLSGIFETGKPWVSEIFHEAFLQVDEDGTEAAAATAEVGYNSAPPEPGLLTEIEVDHPFLFVIKDNDQDLLLFMGSFVEPANKK